MGGVEVVPLRGVVTNRVFPQDIWIGVSIGTPGLLDGMLSPALFNYSVLSNHPKRFALVFVPYDSYRPLSSGQGCPTPLLADAHCPLRFSQSSLTAIR